MTKDEKKTVVDEAQAASVFNGDEVKTPEPESSEKSDTGIFYVLREHVISDKVKYFDKHGFRKIFHTLDEATECVDQMNEDNTDENISYIIVRIA